jgi:hypothetical protein
MVGVSLLCGMGITVPLLFAHAIFGTDPLLFSGSQVGLLLGTLGAALVGSAVLLRPHPPRDGDPRGHAVAEPGLTVPAVQGSPRGPANGKDGADGKNSEES